MLFYIILEIKRYTGHNVPSNDGFVKPWMRLFVHIRIVDYIQNLQESFYSFRSMFSKVVDPQLC